MATTTKAKRLLSSFKALEITAAQVRSLLPDWWVDEVAESEDGLLELQLVLARRLSLSLSSLQVPDGIPSFQASSHRFKTVHPEGSSQLAVSAAMGTGLARLVVSASGELSPAPPVHAAALRQSILANAASVGLEQLVYWSWHVGMPIVHVTGWPKGLRRPDAMCLRVENRPVILIVRNEVSPAKLAYLVAHEIGHIASGHLRADGNSVLVDEALPVNSKQSASDEDEVEADAFAGVLLGANETTGIVKAIGPSISSELKLASQASLACRGKSVNPGQVILAWGRTYKDWKMTNLALKYLQTTQPASRLINDIAKEFLDFSALTGDGLDHLRKLTDMESN